MTTVAHHDQEAEGLHIAPLSTAREADLCARLMAESEPWITLGRSYEASLEIIRDPTKETSVAYLTDALVGFVVLNTHGALVGHVQSLCVIPEIRNQGVGTTLMRWAEVRIFRDFPNVFVTVSSFNRGAFRLYERLDYGVVGELRDLIIPGHSELLLRKTRHPLTELAAAGARAREWRRDDFVIRTDPACLDIDMIHTFLRTTYWAPDLRRDVLERSLRHSLNFGVYHDERQIGFGRTITDFATFAYVADVFILPEYRGRKLSAWLMQVMTQHPDLQGLRRWLLVTRDAGGLYRKSGFEPLSRPEHYMQRPGA